MSNDKTAVNEEVTQPDEGLSLIDIIRLLLQKIKLLILVVLIGGICGGAFGVWHTIDMKYYGTSLEFYVNPEKPSNVGSSSSLAANSSSQYGVYGAYGRHVMDAMIKLLTSESFTEKLLLEDDGLPSIEIYPSLTVETKDYKIADYETAKNKKKASLDAWEAAKALDAPRMEALETLYQKWNAANLPGSFNIESWKKLDDKQSDYPEIEEAYLIYAGKDGERNTAIEKANNLQQEADAAIEVVLAHWRKDPKYASNLHSFQNAIRYSYLGDDEDIADANNLARSFIYVHISVLNNEEFAKDLLTRVKRSVPEYIEQNMIVPTDYEGTSCTRITRNDDIRRTNPNFRRNQSIKYAIIAAFAAGVIAAVLIIFIDAQDKRLRDYEVITRKLKIPVLGIIPTIEEMNQAVENKKHQNKGGN